MPLRDAEFSTRDAEPSCLGVLPVGPRPPETALAAPRAFVINVFDTVGTCSI